MILNKVVMLLSMDIARMIRSDEDVMVIDNKTKHNITSATLTQIIFEAEKKTARYAPLFTLRDIIQNTPGNMSSYLAKLGAFPEDYAEKQAKQQAAAQVEMNHTKTHETVKTSLNELKQTLEARVANAANQNHDNKFTELPILQSKHPVMGQKTEEPLTLPNSNQEINK